MPVRNSRSMLALGVKEVENKGNKAAGVSSTPDLQGLNCNGVEMRFHPLGKEAGFPLITKFTPNQHSLFSLHSSFILFSLHNQYV